VGNREKGKRCEHLANEPAVQNDAPTFLLPEGVLRATVIRPAVSSEGGKGRRVSSSMTPSKGEKKLISSQ